MIYSVFSLRDIKAAVWSQPFYAVNDAVGVRVFSELARDLNTVVGRHPADFQLYQVAYFDDQTGAFTNVTPPNFLCLAADTLATERPEQPSLLPA